MFKHTGLPCGSSMPVCSRVGKNSAQNQNLLPEQAECSQEGLGYLPGEGGEEKCTVGGETQGGLKHTVSSFRVRRINISLQCNSLGLHHLFHLLRSFSESAECEREAAGWAEGFRGEKQARLGILGEREGCFLKFFFLLLLLIQAYSNIKSN